MARTCSTQGTIWHAYKILAGKLVAKRSWDDNIKMDLEGLVSECMNMIQLSEDKTPWRAFVTM
jgi:hypothetical protein